MLDLLMSRSNRRANPTTFPRDAVPPSPVDRSRGALLALAAVAVASVGAWSTAEAQTAGAIPPPTVRVAPVTTKPVGLTAQFTGRIQAIQSVDIKARVEGYLKSVDFADGSNVKEGDLLYQIDPAPYQASLAQAQAELASAKAAVAGAQADLKNKNLELERQKTLAQRNVSSQAEADQAEADRDVAAADLQSAQAQVQQAEASVTTAQLNLDYTKISAAVAGRMSKTEVTPGALITANGDTMATLVQLDPIRVAFAVPSKNYVDLMQEIEDAGTQTAPEMFEPAITLPNGSKYDQEGKIVFASNQVDPNTDSLTAYADFPNPRAVLLPGQFVVVGISQIDKEELPVIPATAVLRDKDGPYVFVLKSDDTVEQRRIKTSERTQSEVAVTTGLSEGETIVVSGVQKVQPGMKVTPTPAAPAPADSSTSGSSAAASASSGASAAAPAASSTGASGSSASGTASSSAASSGSAASSSSDASSSTPASSTAASSAPASSGTSAAPASDASGSAASAAPASGSSAAPPASDGSGTAASTSTDGSAATGQN